MYKIIFNDDNTYSVILIKDVFNKMFQTTYYFKDKFKEKKDANSFIKKRESGNEM